MTAAQRAAVKLSETRSAINVLLGADRTDTQNAELRELTVKAIQQEEEWRATTVAGEDPEIRTVDEADDSETRERRNLRRQAKVGDFVRAALDDSFKVDGQSAEYAAAVECRGQMPIDLLLDDDEQRGIEHRAVTPAPTANQDLTIRGHRILGRVFAGSVADFLGIGFEQAAVGVASFPVLATGPTVAWKAKDAAAPNTAGSYSVTHVKPGRITGMVTIRREDMAVLADLEGSLRRDIRQTLVNELNGNMIVGTNTDGQLNGLIPQLDAPTAQGAQAAFATYISKIATMVDGTYADTLAALRVLVGTSTYQDMASKFATSMDAVSALNYLTQHTGGLRSSSRIPATATTGGLSKNQQAIVVRPSADRRATVVAWRGLSFIRDEISDSTKAHVHVTALGLFGGVVIHRKPAYDLTAFQIVA